MGKTGGWTLSSDAVRLLKWLSEGETFIEFQEALLDELDGEGMVDRFSGEMKAKTISLTERGRKVVKKIRKIEEKENAKEH